jgi:hypothetical protein
LLPKLLKELAGVTITPEEFKKKWGQLLRETTKEEFTDAFTSWLERCKKYVCIGGSFKL